MKISKKEYSSKVLGCGKNIFSPLLRAFQGSHASPVLMVLLVICLLTAVLKPQSAYASPDKGTLNGNPVSNPASPDAGKNANVPPSGGTAASKENGPASVKPALPKASHTSDFTWGSPQTLHGIYSSVELYFTLPTYWDAQYAYVQLDYRVSQLIKGAPCSLTFSINKQSFYSCQVAYTNEAQALYVLIPKDLLKNDAENRSNFLEISGYARLFDEAGCIDDFSNASWITISEASGVQIGYEAKPHNNRIDYYPYPFMSALNPTGSDTAVVVSDSTQNEEVAAAMFIMSNLSSQTVLDNKITVGAWKDVQGGDFKNRIFIGLSKDLPQELQKHVQPYQDQLRGQVLILFVNDDKNQPLLIIVSEDADCLMEAGHLLADGERVYQEKGNAALVKKGTADVKSAAKQLNDMNADRYTMQGMTGGGVNFVGPFRQERTLFLPVSSDYTLSSAGKVSLNFRYSKNLDFKRSMLTVYWGDIPIGSKKLTLEHADADELTFFVPADVVGTNAGKMVFAFDLEIADLICTPRQDEMPWAYITQNSSLFLPSENDTQLRFDNRPAPFQKNGRLNDVLLIVSDSPTMSELTLLGRTVALYGKKADAYGKLKVRKAGEFSEKDADYNIITSGMPSTNRVISSINEQLYFKYSEDGSKLLTNEKLILSTDYAKSTGTLQLLRSPYARNRALLVLTGPNDAALQRINNLVSNEKLSWNLKNDCVLVDSEGKTKSYQFQKNTITDQKPSLIQSVTANKSSLLFALAGTSIMLVLFLAMVLIILRLQISKRTPGTGSASRTSRRSRAKK